VKAWLQAQLEKLGVRASADEADATDSAASEPPLSILLVDDTPTNLQVLTQTLQVLGHKLLAANSGKTAIQVAKRAKPALILLDVMMPEMDGFQTCEQLKADPELAQAAVIFCTALSDVDAKVRGFELGAVDFITKPYQAEEVVARVTTHLTIQQLARALRQQNRALRQEIEVMLDQQKDALRRLEVALHGNSSACRILRHSIEEYSKNDDPVLLHGSPGCGDEAVARAIHAASPRRRKPFIVADCTSMLSSSHGDIFATNAESTVDQVTKHELANGGTLYLEHIQHLPPQAQERLAAALGDRTTGPDVRLIAFSSFAAQPLPDDFDDFLRQRLARATLRLPGLVERSDDIPLLANDMLEAHARRLGKSVQGFDAAALANLGAHSWPGNLRELEDVVVRSIVNSRGSVVKVDPQLLQGGTPLGSYRLLTKLGQGGMGEVWRAKHQYLARPAAIKLIKSEGSSNRDEVTERFRREAAATAQLCSPHTVTLYDFGVSDSGDFYYVMELLDGMDLETLVRSFGKQPAPRVASFLIQACRSLAEAHRHGMVHRDIKPANLHACRLGVDVDVLKVLDFGMVGRRGDPEDTRLTRQESLYGTPDYMAPEMCLDGRTLDGKTDMYSLGATAYWLLTGERVFEAEQVMQLLLKHLNEAPPRVTDKADVPAPMADLIMRCLAKSPADRPSAAELWRELEASGIQDKWTTAQARAWWEEHLPEQEAL
jgi:DNA-binding NtrC family response regulator